MKKNVLIGCHNIASQFKDWEKGFNENGFNVIKVLHYKESKFTKSKNAIILNRWINLKVFNKKIVFELPWQQYYRKRIKKKLLKKCDIFFFVWSTFEKDFSDLKWLKENNKKIVVLFVGNDVRAYNPMVQDFKRFGMDPIEYHENFDKSEKGLENSLNRIRSFEKYADVILSLPNQSSLALRPYSRAHFLIDISKIEHHPKQRKIPKIIHAASSPEFKGSKYIIPVLQKLREEGLEFEYEILTGTPYTQIFSKYYECDILIGQLLAPSGGKQERELLAAGKVVMSHMAYDYEDHIGKDCPIIDVNKNNLESSLRDIIKNHKKRTELALLGRQYVMKHSNPKQICADLIMQLNKDEIELDFYPTFLKEKYKPESEKEIKLINHYNDFVSDCEWYKENITSGERQGLKF